LSGCLDAELVTDVALLNCEVRDARWNKEAAGKNSSAHGTWTRAIETLGGSAFGKAFFGVSGM